MKLEELLYSNRKINYSLIIEKLFIEWTANVELLCRFRYWIDPDYYGEAIFPDDYDLDFFIEDVNGNVLRIWIWLDGIRHPSFSLGTHNKAIMHGHIDFNLISYLIINLIEKHPKLKDEL